MGIKEIYYQWQENRHRKKLKDIEKTVLTLKKSIQKLEKEAEKEQKILKRIESSGYGKPKLLHAPRPTQKELLDMCSTSKFETTSSELQTSKTKNSKGLVNVQCQKVTDPELYLDSYFDDRETSKIDIEHHLSVGVYSRLDVRTPKQVIDNQNNIYAQSTATLRSDIYAHPGSMSSSISPMNNPYTLCIGTAGRFDGKPLEYIEVTRGNGTRFYIAERFSKNSLANQFGLKEYSIKRFNPQLKCYEQDIIFSEGIDLARMLDQDINYTTMITTRLLSEEQLKKSLEKPVSVRNIEQRTDITHAAGYVGFLDTNTLKKRVEFKDLDKLQAARETLATYQKGFSAPCNENDILMQMHPEKYIRISTKTKSLYHDSNKDYEH